MTISARDKYILRDTAAHQMELAYSPRNIALEKLWLRHNACLGERPTVCMDWRPFAGEIITPLLRCEGEDARSIEYALCMNFLEQELFNDDQVVPAYMPVHVDAWFAPFGVKPGEDSELYEIPKSQDIVKDLKRDFHLLHKTKFGVNMRVSQRRLEIYQSLLGDILPVRLTGGCLYALPTRCLAQVMSVDTILTSMQQYPDLFHTMMDGLTEDYIRYFHFCEARGLILPTTRVESVCRGTFAFTNELPGPDVSARRPLTTHDVWGFLGTLELGRIAPELYKEFLYPYFKRIAEMYGMLSYGFFEPVDAIWDGYLSDMPNLRKVCISSDCNEELMGERLRHTNIVFHRKTSPAILGAEGELDENAVRAGVKRTMAAARGCEVEFSQRGARTVHGDVARVRRYVELVREYSAD